MVKKQKRRKITEGEVLQGAIIYGLEQLRESHNIDLGSEQLFKYVDQNKLNEVWDEGKKTSAFKKLKSNKKRIEYLQKGIINYIESGIPFDERGQRLIESSLEGIVAKPFAFTKKGREEKHAKAIAEYRDQIRTARDISYAVSKNPNQYSDNPELVEAVNESRYDQGRGALAEILYASGNIGKKTYQDIKSTSRESSDKILSLAKKYVESPALGYASAILGLGIILLTPTSITGNVVEVGEATRNFGLFATGIALLFISGICFSLRKLKHEKEKTKKEKKKGK